MRGGSWTRRARKPPSTKCSRAAPPCRSSRNGSSSSPSHPRRKLPDRTRGCVGSDRERLACPGFHRSRCGPVVVSDRQLDGDGVRPRSGVHALHVDLERECPCHSANRSDHRLDGHAADRATERECSTDRIEQEGSFRNEPRERSDLERHVLGGSIDSVARVAERELALRFRLRARGLDFEFRAEGGKGRNCFGCRNRKLPLEVVVDCYGERGEAANGSREPKLANRADADRVCMSGNRARRKTRNESVRRRVGCNRGFHSVESNYEGIAAYRSRTLAVCSRHARGTVDGKLAVHVGYERVRPSRYRNEGKQRRTGHDIEAVL